MPNPKGGHDQQAENILTQNPPPVDPEELRLGMQVGTAACAYRLPMEGPGTRSLTIVDEDEETATTYRFTDDWFNRFTFAVVDAFREDREKANAVMLRFMAMTRLSRQGLLKRWVRDDGDPDLIQMHPAVVDVAASALMTKDGFDSDDFLREVESIAAKDYPDLDPSHDPSNS